MANLRRGYVVRIKNRIESFLVTPPGAKGVSGLVVVDVNLDDGGNVLGFPEIAESSGISEYDESALRAVIQSSPLPVPKDPEIMKDFRSLRLRISPE